MQCGAIVELELVRRARAADPPPLGCTRPTTRASAASSAIVRALTLGLATTTIGLTVGLLIGVKSAR